MRSILKRILSIAVFMLTMYGGRAYSTLVTIPFNTPGVLASPETVPFGISTFVSNSYFYTQGISGAFTGNVTAPIGPPSAIELGPTPGPATYFHFSPLPGYKINSIGISATGAFTGQSTTFRVFAANESLSFIQYDTTMTPTAAGIAGLNGGAVFLSANALTPVSPITAFRVWQLDDGFGILDNLVADVSAVPEPAPLLIWSGLTGLALCVVVIRRRLKTANGS